MNKDEKEIKELIEKYQTSAADIIYKIKNTKARSVQDYAVRVKELFKKTEISLIKFNRKWTKENIAGIEKAPIDSAFKDFYKSHKIPESPAEFARHTFVELSDSVKKASAHARRLVNETLEKITEERTPNLNEVKQLIADTMQAEGVLNVEYSDGKKMPLESYAAMTARSARIETENVESFKRTLAEGSDLVRCTTMGVTCKICAMYEGRVYSITGNDKRFPALYETALKHGYSLIHPNCRHEFLRFTEELEDKASMERILKESNRPFVDSRPIKVRDAYAKWQSYNRQVRNEYKEYQDMKTAFGEQMQYKTIGGFRRSKRAKAEQYADLKKQFKFEQNYTKAAAAEPKITEDINNVVKQSGGQLVGLENRLKTKESYLRKANTGEYNYLEHEGKRVNDTIRYTVQNTKEKLTDNYFSFIDNFKEKGYTLIKVKNTFVKPNAIYKGLNVELKNSDGQVFEVQFHTKQSFELKNGDLHTLYEKFRTTKDRLEKDFLFKQMKELSSGVVNPKNIEEIE